jgi:hypothetical protein
MYRFKHLIYSLPFQGCLAFSSLHLFLQDLRTYPLQHSSLFIRDNVACDTHLQHATQCTPTQRWSPCADCSAYSILEYTQLTNSLSPILYKSFFFCFQHFHFSMVRLATKPLIICPSCQNSFFFNIGGGLISLWLYKENNNLRDWKNVFTLHIPTWAPHTYDFVVLTSLTHPWKFLLVVLQIANKKSQRLISTHTYPFSIKSTFSEQNILCSWFMYI